MHRSLVLACSLWSLALLAAPSAAAPEPPAPVAPVPAIEVTATRVEVEHSPAISTDLLFETGDTAIRPAARPVLDAIAKALGKDPTTTIAISCHTDDTAPDNDRSGAYNQKLSRERAEAVLAYLAKRGVAAKRMVARGLGRDKPVADNASDDGKRMNRRIELAIVAEVRPPDAADLAIYTRS